MRRTRRRRVAEADAAKLPALVGKLGHQLRTPLNAIFGFSELITSGTFGPLRNPRYLEYCKLIQRSAGQLLGMIDGLQRLVELQHDERGALAEVDLEKLAHGALEAVSAVAARRRIVLRLERARTPPLVRGESALLAQLLEELVRNAVTFTHDGGRVTVRAGTGKGGPRVVVTDTGVGVPPPARARVFEPFVQLKPEGIAAHDGPGLGLAIARTIALRHGAGIGLAAAPDGGTRAILAFPASAAVRSRRATARPARAGRRSRSAA